MCQIMDSLHKYVPTLTEDKKVTLPNGVEIELQHTEMWETLFGGDQLTVARARGSIAVRYTHNSKTEQLLGLLPVVEDWHTKMTLLQVYCCSRIFNTFNYYCFLYR